jgi:CIC family chloride channel protein
MKKFSNSGMWNIPVVENGNYKGFVSRSKVLTVYRRKLREFAS